MVENLKKWAWCLVALFMWAPGVSLASGLKIALQSDEGTYFSRCTGCQNSKGNRIPDTLTLHKKSPADADSQFELVLVGNGKIALKSDNGKFVGRCNGCIMNGAKADFATVHVDAATQPYAQFTLERLANGKYALKADTGKYLARCYGCSPGATQSNTVSMHATNPAQEVYAQWTITPLFPKGSKIALQADSGMFFSRCHDCQKSVDNKYPDTVTTHVKTASGAYSQFEVVEVAGGMIAFKSADTGKFVGRCTGCITSSKSQDFLTVNLTDPAQAEAQFKPVLLNNGKWALEADNQKYAALCNQCSAGAKQPDAVTVDVTDPGQQASAQWNITYVP